MGLEMWINKLKLKKWRRYGLVTGKDFRMMKGCAIDPSFPWLVSIGDNVCLAPNVTILAHDASSKVHLGYTRLGRVSIGNNVFVGAGSIILPNVAIGNDVVIAAGSVVSRDVPDNSVAGGCPARVIKSTEEFKKKHGDSMDSGVKLDESYTIFGGVTAEKREDMKLLLEEGGVYIV